MPYSLNTRRMLGRSLFDRATEGETNNEFRPGTNYFAKFKNITEHSTLRQIHRETVAIFSASICISVEFF